MADTVWPPNLPNTVLVETATHRVGAAARRTSMEQGPPKRRKMSSPPPDEIPVSFIVESDALAIEWLDFYRLNAARTFDGLRIPLGMDETAVLAFKSPAEAVLVDKPQTWRCSAMLEVVQ
jgi:hypothetical protein